MIRPGRLPSAGRRRRKPGSSSASLADQEPGAGKVVNRSYLLDNSGAIVARYDKLHLFDVDLPSGEQYRSPRP